MRNATHPSEAELALYAAGDLSWAQQKWTGRHVSRCGECQSVVVEYSEFRPTVQEFPTVPSALNSSAKWARIASEMSANIRLGLEAGECVNPRLTVRPSARVPLRFPAFGGFTGLPSWHRLGLACGVLAAVAGIAFLIEHPRSLSAPPVTGTILEASESGLQISEGTQTLRLLNTSGTDVSRTVGSRGEVGARYLDPNGYVTVSQVYGQ